MPRSMTTFWEKCERCAGRIRGVAMASAARCSRFSNSEASDQCGYRYGIDLVGFCVLGFEALKRVKWKRRAARASAS